VKEDEMGMACRMHGRKGMHVGYWWESHEERRNHYEDIDVCKRIILK
jgi:hypothetical protein